MRSIRLLALTAVAVFSLLFLVYGSSDSEADSEQYIVYYLIDDPRIDAESYSIDCEGIVVSSSYVYFKVIEGSNTTLGTLPATENIVSRHYERDVSYEKFVVNPYSTSDISGWYTTYSEGTYSGRVESTTTTVGSLDTDDDGIVFLHLRLAKVYDVIYFMKNYKSSSHTSSNFADFLWYDGHYLETSSPYKAVYNRNYFSEVDYITQLIEGQTISGKFPDTGNVYNVYNYPNPSNPYLALQYWAKTKGSYEIDSTRINNRDINWVLRTNDGVITQYDTPVYLGLQVTDSLDTDGDGAIELYGTSTAKGETKYIHLTVIYAQQDHSLRSYENSGYDGQTYETIINITATGNTTISGNTTITLPNYDGFSRPTNSDDVETYQNADKKLTTSFSFNNGNVTISCSIPSGANTYSGIVVFNYARLTTTISVNGNPQTVAYDCDLPLTVNQQTDILTGWQTTNLSNSVWKSGSTYYYTVSLTDLNAVNPTINPVWLDDGVTVDTFIVVYHTRTTATLLNSIAETGQNITLPMISNSGYAHLGWSLTNPDAQIQNDDPILVDYPGRVSLQPSSLSSIYYDVDSGNSHIIRIHLYAIWCITYTITFYGNNPTSGSMTDQGPVRYNEQVTLNSNTFKKTGYVFAGWGLTIDADPLTDTIYGDGAVVSGLTTTPNGTATLYAIWQQSIAYVVYDGMNATGGTMAVQEVTLRNGSGTVNLDLNQFTRTGYTFYGWATSFERADAGIRDYTDGQESIRIRASLSLFAVWTPIKYYVDFNANGGSGTMTAQEFTYGVQQNLKANAFTNGTTAFKGWVDSEGNRYMNGESVKDLSSTQDARITLYAIWSVYYIRFESNGGTGSADTHEIVSGIAFTLPKNVFTNEGHTFQFWNTSSDGSGTSYQDQQRITTDLAGPDETLVLYAIWDQWADIIYILSGSTDAHETVRVMSTGGTFAPVTPSLTGKYEGCSLVRWCKAEYENSTIVSMTHMTYGLTLGSITAYSTYVAFLAPGDSLLLEKNDGSDTFVTLEFTDRSGGITSGFEGSGNEILVGWSDSSEGDVVYSERTPLHLVNITGADDELFAVWISYKYIAIAVRNADS